VTRSIARAVGGGNPRREQARGQKAELAAHGGVERGASEVDREERRCEPAHVPQAAVAGARAERGPGSAHERAADAVVGCAADGPDRVVDDHSARGGNAARELIRVERDVDGPVRAGERVVRAGHLSAARCLDRRRRPAHDLADGLLAVGHGVDVATARAGVPRDAAVRPAGERDRLGVAAVDPEVEHAES
jgi:hypothetical protein